MEQISRRRLTWLGYYGLTLIGIYLSVLGPGLPSIAAQAHSTLAIAGSLFSAVAAGSLMTSIGAGRAMDRLGRRPLLIAGALVNGLGCIGLSLATSWPEALAAGLFMGSGDSMIVVGFHVLFTDLYGHEPGAALNRLNVFFGLGALAGPAIAGLSILAVGDIRYALWLVAAGQALIAILLLRSGFPALPNTALAGQALGLRQIVRSPLLWLLAPLLVLYVAIEAGLGDWAYTYLHQGGFAVLTASALTSGYWLALTLGRAISPWLLRRLRDPHFLALAALVATIVSLLLVVIAGWRVGGAACILLLGLAFGPIWPQAFAVGTAAYREGAGAVSGVLNMAGALGGLVGPWLQGVLLLQAGARWGMAFTFSGCAVILILAVLTLRTLPVPPPASAPATSAASGPSR